MMARIEILVEEKSMKVTLDALLPRVLPECWFLGVNYFIREHQGKSDLQKSIPNKIKVFSNFYEPVGVIIVHDQDSNDCKELKKKLLESCRSNGSCKILIRIACRELESWFLGDLHAVQNAYPKFRADKYIQSAKFRNPDTLNASDELRKILPDFQKVQSAVRIASFLSTDDRNRSQSFRVFLTGVLRFFDEMSVA